MSDLADWLMLWRVPGIGPITFDVLMRHFGSPDLVLRAGHSELKRFGLPDETVEGICWPDHRGIEQDLAWTVQPGREILRISDPVYPKRLREISNPPLVLFVSGDASCLSDPQIAIVGSRHPTPGGRKNAQAFAMHLARAGLTVTSCLAAGIDGAGHEAALKAGGLSIAVAANGPGRVYPARHRELAHWIVEHGAIISEFPTGVAPRPENFPRRNRLISGLMSLGVLVVEAARRSGSLITASFAAEQGREVFVIPGSIHNPAAEAATT